MYQFKRVKLKTLLSTDLSLPCILFWWT